MTQDQMVFMLAAIAFFVAMFIVSVLVLFVLVTKKQVHTHRVFVYADEDDDGDEQQAVTFTGGRYVGEYASRAKRA